MVHNCNKERELGEIHTNIVHIKDRMDEIHKTLVGGDGKIGLVAESNKLKGAIKAIWIVGLVLFSLVSLVLAMKP